jgi:hypothetical protein
LQDQKPSLIKPYTELVDIFVQRDKDPNLTMWLESMKDRALAVIDSDPDKDLVQRSKDSLKEPGFVEMQHLVKPDNAEPYAVVTHGDCWNNNMMFKNEVIKHPKTSKNLNQISKFIKIYFSHTQIFR